MRKFVINLDRSPERLASFYSRNEKIVGIERFRGIDGRNISIEDLLEKQIIREGGFYNKNSIGCSLSHIELWKLSVASQQSICVIEDDAVLAKSFETHLDEISKREEDWDFIAWGWNFDAPLVFEFMPGVCRGVLNVSQDDLRKKIGLFSDTNFSIEFRRLIKSFGTMCYSITPKTAKFFIENCIPLMTGDVSIDGMINQTYPKIRAYVAVPPTAVSENDHAQSTVINS